jgi:hypothetical protein
VSELIELYFHHPAYTPLPPNIPILLTWAHETHLHLIEDFDVFGDREPKRLEEGDARSVRCTNTDDKAVAWERKGRAAEELVVICRWRRTESGSV